MVLVWFVRFSFVLKILFMIVMVCVDFYKIVEFVFELWSLNKSS